MMMMSEVMMQEAVQATSKDTYDATVLPRDLCFAR